MKNNLAYLLLLGEVMLSSFAAQPQPSPECTAVLNGGVRECCPTTGLCKDSSCTVFGFPNSAKSNCAVQGDKKCLTIYCDWALPNCSKLSDKVHCYGTVKCTDGSTSCCADGPPCSGNDYGALCLGDGNSQNYKVCDNTCNNDNDCHTGLKCVKGSTGNTKYCVAPQASQSPRPSPGHASSPSPPISPDPANIEGGPDQCEACPDQYKAPVCQKAEQEQTDLGRPKIIVPNCDFDTLLDALKPYHCKVVDGCDTLLCDDLIPDGALNPAFHACQIKSSDTAITTQEDDEEHGGPKFPKGGIKKVY